jgi:tetratricopeptide (TPR) repeat protein
MNRITNQSSKKRNLFVFFRKFDFASLSIRLILPITLLSILLAIGFLLFRTKPEEQTSVLTEPNISAKTVENITNVESPDINVLSSELPVSNVTQEQNISLDTTGKNFDLKSIGWSWIDQDVKKEATWTADEAFHEATKYVEGAKPRQREALKMYQRVLDAKPSRQMELKVRLTMGSRMMILYDPSLGETEMYDEALKWYEQLVHDFNDLGNHTDLMTAKIHLGDLYCWRHYHGISEAKKASALCLEVIKIPEKDIIFDNPLENGLNLEYIKNAKAPGSRRSGTQGPSEIANQLNRQHLLERRQEVINRYRRVAIQSLIAKQSISGFPYEAYLERLLLLKKERPDDQLYQKMLDDKIREITKILVGNHSDFEGVLKKGLNGGNVQ